MDMPVDRSARQTQPKPSGAPGWRGHSVSTACLIAGRLIATALLSLRLPGWAGTTGAGYGILLRQPSSRQSARRSSISTASLAITRNSAPRGLLEHFGPDQAGRECGGAGKNYRKAASRLHAAAENTPGRCRDLSRRGEWLENEIDQASAGHSIRAESAPSIVSIGPNTTMPSATCSLSMWMSGAPPRRRHGRRQFLPCLRDGNIIRTELTAWSSGISTGTAMGLFGQPRQQDCAGRRRGRRSRSAEHFYPGGSDFCSKL